MSEKVTDARFQIGGNVWSTKPADFEITTSEFVFINTSEDFDVKMEFTSDLISPNPIEIPAGGDFAISVASGKQDRDQGRFVDTCKRHN